MRDRDEHVSEVRAWEEGTCQECGFLFPRRNHYEQRCPLCFKLHKGYNVLWGDQAFLWAQDRLLELQMQLRDAKKELAAEAKKAKTAKAAPPADPGLAGLKGGLLRQVIILCHPDKHGDSERATKVTQELLRLRSAPRRAPKKRTRRKP